jgi:uncharacterized protein (DUF58 family)
MSAVRVFWWHRLLARAPRRLTVTKAGKAVIAVALVSGMAALNTGNNLLFLAWGMVLSAMVVSGLLSEATLRVADVTLTPPDELRVEVQSYVKMHLTNSSRFMPALAIEIVLTWTDDHGENWSTYAPYQLRLDAQNQRYLFAPVRPLRRGPLRLIGFTLRTAYPFGLFIKDRPLKVPQWELWVLPKAGPMQPGAQVWQGRLGQSLAQRAGDGEDYFAMRLYRPGDALKHVLWRRVAKANRWLVLEREARVARQVVFVLALDTAAAATVQENALMSVGTLLETVLQQGMDVGLIAPGLRVEPAADPFGSGRQRHRLLLALARLAVNVTPSLPLARMGTAQAYIALDGAGLLPPPSMAKRLTLIMPS